MTRLYLPPIAGLHLAKALPVPAGRPCAVAVLTYPAPDADRDYVRPDGGDWTSRFPSNPVVNWDHGPPVGCGTVAVVPVAVRGVPTPLPVGTTHFFQTAADANRIDLTEYETRRDGTRKAVGRFVPDDCVRLAADVHRLVREDAASGVSIEFERTGDEGHDWWPTGATSPVSRRPSCHFERWTGLGWAHTPHPINRHAGVLIDSPFFDKAFRIAETGRFPGGSHCHPLIRKSLAAALPKRPAAVTGGFPAPPTAAPRVRKAMDETAAADATETTETTETPAMKPTVALLMTLVQGMTDLANMAREQATGPTVEHEAGIELATQAADALDAQAQALRDATTAMFPDAGIDVPDDLAADEYGPARDDMPADASGALIGKSYRKGFPVQRFKMAHLGTRPTAPTTKSVPDAVRMATIAARTKRLEAQSR